jgi:hypothetical protein
MPSWFPCPPPRGECRRGAPVLAQVSGREIVPLLQAAIAAFPERQRLVMRAFVEHFPDSAPRPALRRFASVLAGADLSAISVKRALQEGRAKLRALLLRQGFAPGEPAA